MELRQMSEEGNSTMTGWMQRRIEKSRARCERVEVEKDSAANRRRRVDVQKQNGNDSTASLTREGTIKAEFER
jgi:hypothetical protein